MNYLASYDKRGLLCVWSFAKKRWICKCKFDALGNTNSKVTDLIWSDQGLCLISHPGGDVTIFYPDTRRVVTFPLGFGTGSSHACFTISPCNGILYVGTNRGKLKIVDLTGVTTYSLRKVKCSVVHMCCSPEHTLAIGFKDGIVSLFKNEDEESFLYKELYTSFHLYCMEWSEFSNYLAILGVKQERTHLRLYSPDGILLLNLTVPECKQSFTTETMLAITWGHRERRVFVTNGADIAVVRIVADDLTSLMEMSCISVYKHESKRTIKSSSTLPPSMKLMLTHFMTNTIYDPISGNCTSLKYFNTDMIEAGQGCIYCTMRHNQEERFYTLFLERMGSLVPLLEAHQVGRVRPKFVIYDRFSTKENTSEILILGKVVSNVWGTKFKILEAGLHKKCLAKVQYKVSLIHWLPRKMKVIIPKLEAKTRVSVSNTSTMSEQNMCMGEHTEDAYVKMHNCSPQWNSEFRVYQLDCGGRVILESEKNFRFDYVGSQALQFGRIGDHSYTLDFGYPFSAIQAFGIALTSLTHRLK